MADNKKIDLSNWLLASDIDGTLNDKTRKLVYRNYDMIQRFINEHGGNFTLASGRSPESMRKHFKRLDIADGKAIVLNGAGIYDFAEEKMVWHSPMNEHCIDMVRQSVKKFPTLAFQVITDKAVYLFRPTATARILAVNAQLPIKYYYNFESIPKENWYKVIYTAIPPAIQAVKKFIEKLSDTTENLMLSSVWSYEMVNEDTNKGVAVLKLADILGVDHGKTAAIGDYFNDYEMLKRVALPACCGQAPKGMKEISRFVAGHCNHGAVADLIEYIINNHNIF
ncbi:MAG: HAD family phosphatase [Clostridia bacterium]|nr:HAD family phosphatase [Clostridia bacterium]